MRTSLLALSTWAIRRNAQGYKMTMKMYLVRGIFTKHNHCCRCWFSCTGFGSPSVQSSLGPVTIFSTVSIKPALKGDQQYYQCLWLYHQSEGKPRALKMGRVLATWKWALCYKVRALSGMRAHYPATPQIHVCVRLWWYPRCNKRKCGFVAHANEALYDSNRGSRERFSLWSTGS